MSGGSMNYICWQIEEEADKMGDPELIALVKDVATLMHDREWYLSGDTSDETWKESKEAFNTINTITYNNVRYRYSYIYS